MASDTIIVVDARLSYPKLAKAEHFRDDPTTPLRYDATFLIEKNSADHKKVEAAIMAAALKKYPDPKKAKQAVESARGQSNKFCFLDGDETGKDAEAGLMVLASHRYQDDGRPKVVDRNNNVVVPGDAGWPYGGCYVKGIVEIWAQTKGFPGIRATLIGVQFVKDGDSFGSTASTAVADDFFAPMGMAEENEADALA